MTTIYRAMIVAVIGTTGTLSVTSAFAAKKKQQ